MQTVRRGQWFFTLCCFLVGRLADSSSLPSTRPLSVSSKVGNQVVLPCSWKQRLGDVAPPACHIQWNTPLDTVFELRGEQKWQAEEFQGRAEVPEERLESGDCSLIISDVQVGDSGRYESFMVVDGVRDTKSRVFIQSVKLSVVDHKSLQSLGPGEDLVLDLYTHHSVRVVFQGSNSSEWSDLWMREDENSERLVKHPLREQLTIKQIKYSDEGTYKVLDAQGLTVSTVRLSVEEKATAQKVYQTHLENPELTGDAAKSSSSAPFVLYVLFASFQILHLF